MQDKNIFHVKASVFMYAFNVICLGTIAASLLLTHNLLLGSILAFVTFSFALIGVLLFMKYNSRFVSAFSNVPVILEKVISKSAYPITVCEHVVNKLGVVTPKLVFANNAYLALKNSSLKDVLGKKMPLPQEMSDYERNRIDQAFQKGEAASARIIDKDSSGRLFENELTITPVVIDGAIAYWLCARNFVHYLDNNVIPLEKQQLRAEHPLLD